MKQSSRLKVNFVSSDGRETRTVDAKPGQNLLDIAHAYDIELEGKSPVYFFFTHPLYKNEFILISSYVLYSML